MNPRTSNTISIIDARRISLNAQGFGEDKAKAPSRNQLHSAIKKIGLLQLDSVNVVIRSHYLPMFSRRGAYDTKSLDSLSNKGSRKLYEYWGHEASLIPVEFQPLLRWRMEDAREGKSIWAGPSKIAREKPDFIKAVLQEIGERGPIGAGELSQGGKSTGNWWGWSDGKRAVEYLFWTGQLTAASRRGFERLYDLPDRVIPKPVLEIKTPSRDDAQRTLVDIAARAMGLATEADLRDYFRLPLVDARTRTQELVDLGVLTPMSVENWKQTAYLHHDVSTKFKSSSAVLSPFDSLIWSRPRTERVFNFHYRLAFYTPKHKRTQGYYVMPFLLGENLVARVDLKSDRKEARLLILGGHAEPGVDVSTIAPALKLELRNLANWLGLEHVTIKARTELGNALRKA